MKWEILADIGPEAASRDKVIGVLLKNRGLLTGKEIDEFLNPPDPDSYSIKELGIDTDQFSKGINRIKKAVRDTEPIVIYGDYDADGICATAILWESIWEKGLPILPFIPQREDEGYGLSKEGIDNILADEKYGMGAGGLIITVDSGIGAHKAIDYARGKGIEVVVVDHHEKPDKLPDAAAIIHTTKLCASGEAYYLGRELGGDRKLLELAAIATVTDLMPLQGPNRSILKYGLEYLNRTERVGLRSLIQVGNIPKIGTYEIGYMIGPRINASGRIESALTALRLLCEKDWKKALEYAWELNEINKRRQEMTEEMTHHAIKIIESRIEKGEMNGRINVIDDESYNGGIVGLTAGKLVEKYYMPAIVIARKEKESRASARSIAGFNIYEAIKDSERLLVNAGGHPGAAGFTIETARISEFTALIVEYAKRNITDDMLERKLKVDMELGLLQVELGLYREIEKFAPFGFENPEPVFASRVLIESIRAVGQEGKHLKLQVGAIPDIVNSGWVDAIGFGLGEWAGKLKTGDQVEVAYTIDLNVYNGNQSLQLKLKDLKHG